MTERELQSAVIECARLLGWRVAHFRPALTSKGWRTPVEGDGKGFPDLVLVRAGRLVFAELKSDRGVVSREQASWNYELQKTRAELYIWKPADWIDGTIESRLR